MFFSTWLPVLSDFISSARPRFLFPCAISYCFRLLFLPHACLDVVCTLCASCGRCPLGSSRPLCGYCSLCAFCWSWSCPLLSSPVLRLPPCPALSCPPVISNCFLILCHQCYFISSALLALNSTLFVHFIIATSSKRDRRVTSTTLLCSTSCFIRIQD